MPLAPKTPASASRLPLLALALASFGIGTTEFVIMGLLPDVAGDLGVTIPQGRSPCDRICVERRVRVSLPCRCNGKNGPAEGVASADRHLHSRQSALRAGPELCFVDGRENRNGALSRRILRTRSRGCGYSGAGAEEGTGDRNDVRWSHARQWARRSVRHRARRSCRLEEYVLGACRHWLRRGICPLRLAAAQHAHSPHEVDSRSKVAWQHAGDFSDADQRGGVREPLRCLHLHYADPGERDVDLTARGYLHAASVRHWTHCGQFPWRVARRLEADAV